MRAEREFFIDNLLVRIHYIIVIIKWTGLAPWEFEFPFPGSLRSVCRQQMSLSCFDPNYKTLSWYDPNKVTQ